MTFNGYYINLKSSSERDYLLRKHLTKIKLINNFKRFEAYEPNPSEDFKGIKKGEYGLWISIMKILEKIQDDNDNSFVLLIEDDFRFNPSSKSRLENIINIIDNKKIDIFFLDYLINIPLLKKINFIIQKKVSLNNFDEVFVSANNFYYACTSSFLIRKSSAKFLLVLLKKIFHKSDIRLVPIDMLLKYLFKKKVIKGNILVPPIGSPDWELDKDSTIQKNLDKSIKKAMRAYLLFRCAASGTKSIRFCSNEFANIINKKIELEKYNNLKDFIVLVSNNEGRIRHDW